MYEENIELEKLKTAETETGYWLQMKAVARAQTKYWVRKTELLEPQVALELTDLL